MPGDPVHLPAFINDAGQILMMMNGVYGLWTNGAFEPFAVPAGFLNLQPTKLNNLGRVVGAAKALSSGDDRAFFWEGGTLTITDVNTLPRDLNDQGQMVGVDNNTRLPIVWDDGVVVTLPVANTGITEAKAINNAGVIVGTQGQPAHAVRWAEGALEHLIPDAIGIKVNDAGEVLVRLFASRGPAIYDEGTVTPLPAPSCCWETTWPMDLNDQGYAIGFGRIYDEFSNERGTHGVVWVDGQMIELPAVEGRSFTIVYDINNNGQIVGQSFNYHFDGDFDFGHPVDIVPTLWRVTVAPPTPQEVVEQVEDEIGEALATGELTKEEAAPLLVKIEAVTRKLEDGNTRAAANLLGAFAKQVEAGMKSGRISSTLGNSLIELAKAAAGALAS